MFKHSKHLRWCIVHCSVRHRKIFSGAAVTTLILVLFCIAHFDHLYLLPAFLMVFFFDGFETTLALPMARVSSSFLIKLADQLINLLLLPLHRYGQWL